MSYPTRSQLLYLLNELPKTQPVTVPTKWAIKHLVTVPSSWAIKHLASYCTYYLSCQTPSQLLYLLTELSNTQPVTVPTKWAIQHAASYCTY